MRIRIASDLILLNLLVLVLVLVFFLSTADIIRIILGLPLVLFFPGYVLMAALYPRKDQIDGIQRLAFSFGLSLAIVPLIGLVLNATPWGIAPEPLLSSITAFILSMSVIAWLRRRRLPSSEISGARPGLRIPGGWWGSGWEKALSVLLVVTIVGTITVVGYVIAKPKSVEQFTEFYILGPEGEAIDYQWEVVAGQEIEVITGITNQEHETISYQLVVTLDGERIGETGPITLDHDEKWEQPVGLTISKAANRQKLEFLLYKAQGIEPYSLHLWLNILER